MSASKSLKPYIYLLPGLGFISLFTGYGLFNAARSSLNRQDGQHVLHNYEQLFLNDAFLDSFLVSIWVAFISSAISLLIGIWMTRSLVRLFKNDYWKFIAWFPMLIPHFVAAYIVFLLFAQGGWFSSLSFQAGWIDSMSQFPVIVNDSYYIGVILAYIWKEVPFVVLMLLPVYQEMDFRYEDVSRTLGGGRWTVFRTVEFPWIWPVSLEVFLILFVFVLGAFEVPALLGVTYPKMIPVLAYDWFYQAAWANRPLAYALMCILTVASLIAAFLILAFSRRRFSRWTGRGAET